MSLHKVCSQSSDAHSCIFLICYAHIIADFSVSVQLNAITGGKLGITMLAQANGGSQSVSRESDSLTWMQ